MTELWLGWCAPESAQDLMRALRTVAPTAGLSLASSAPELRERLLTSMPGAYGAIVGLSERGVSDENLAAALARDGRAAEVVLACREATGSLRSRMAQAGVTRIIEVPARLPRPGLASVERVPPAAAAPATAWAGGPDAAGAPALARACGDDAPAALPGPGGLQAASRTPPIVVKEQDGAPVLGFISGRGGVGKTALVATAACIAAGWGMDVALIDLDLSCGNLYTCFGLAHGSDLASLGAHPGAEELGRCRVGAAERVGLWGPCEKPEMAEKFMPQTALLVSFAASRHDLVLVDASTTFTDAVAQMVQMADRVVVVNDERSGALASAARAGSLAVRLGVARTRIVRLANLCDPRARSERFIDRAQGALEESRLYRVFDGDVDAEELLASGHVAELAGSDSPLVESLEGFLAKTLQDLGRLPECEAARKAAEGGARKRRAGFFARRKEAS